MDEEGEGGMGGRETDTGDDGVRAIARAEGRRVRAASARRALAASGLLVSLTLAAPLSARTTAVADDVAATIGGATGVSMPAPMPASAAVATLVSPTSSGASVDDPRAEPFDALPGGSIGPSFRVAHPFPNAGTELELRPLFGTLDGRLFRERVTLADDAGRGVPLSLDGVGFPSVEVFPEPSRRHHRRFVRLLDWHTVQGARGPLARVRCMGLPSYAVAARAALWEETIAELAVEHGLPPSLVMAVVARESCFDPKALSHAGARGLMQLMPATARELGAGNAWNPFANLDAGVRYLAAMHARFGSVELALAAYNAGPGSVRRYGGIPPFAETEAYVERVLAYERRYRALELVASL